MGSDSFKILAITASIGSIILLFPIVISAIRFPKKMPGLYANAPFKLKGFWLKFISILALAFGGFFIIALVMESLTGAMILAGWFIVGVVYYFIWTRYRRLRAKAGQDSAAS
jgi:L-asparagine transporter-like permease